MRKYRIHVCIVATLLTIIFACNQSRSIHKNRMHIATSVFPVSDIIGHLIGNSAESFFLVPAGANPHIYEPVPSDARKLRSVDLFIGVHPEFDGWMTDYLPKHARVRFLVDALENHSEDEYLHETKPSNSTVIPEERHHLENPHIWLSVEKAKTLSLWIVANLIDLDNDNQEVYRKRGTAFQHSLDSLHHEISELFRNVPRKRFIQWHPAWDYFAEDYNLEIIGTIEKGHGDTPSIQYFKELILKSKKYQTNVVVIGLNVEDKSVESLVREINGRLIRLDSMGDPMDPNRNSYIKLMRFNARQLFNGLME